jgi:hypothetical protein
MLELEEIQATPLRNLSVVYAWKGRSERKYIVQAQRLFLSVHPMFMVGEYLELDYRNLCFGYCQGRLCYSLGDVEIIAQRVCPCSHSGRVSLPKCEAWCPTLGFWLLRMTKLDTPHWTA